MSWREVRQELTWGIFLAGLPFAHFALYSKQVNQWYAQTFWAEGWVITLFGLSFLNLKSPQVVNRPLGAWVIWIGLSTIAIWINFLKRDWGHPIGLLSPLAHTFCLVLFYLAAMQDWTAERLQRLLTWLAYSGLLLIAYGGLQLLHFDQFYKFIDNTITMHGKDSLIGTIGNPAYFGIELALLLPIFLWQPQSWWKLMALAASALIVLTLSTSAVVCGALAWLWWGWYAVKRPLWIALVGLLVVTGTWVIATHAFWLNPSGRLEAWQAFAQHYLVGDGKQQITGAGLGRIMGDSHQGLAGWPQVGSGLGGMFRHAHCEFFQVLIEQGVIGLGLVCWGLWDAWRRWWRLPPTVLKRMLGGMGLVYVAAALINNVAHIWVLGSLALVVYCGIYVLAAEQQVKVTHA